MRLICGTFQLDGAPVLHETVVRMCAAMQSPLQPSCVGVWTDGPIGLGVVDFGPEHGSSLLLQTTSGTMLAADIRLDNAGELRTAMNLPASATDVEIAGAQLDRTGAAGAAPLLGEFALAQWLPRDRQLLLVRDALGVRPLVYSHQPGRHLVFASFPAALFASGSVERRLDEAALAREALYRYSHDTTLFAGVNTLRPGHTLAVAPLTMDRRAYWQPQVQPRRHRKPQEAAEELRDLLHAAVNCRLDRVGPVAAHLSGGLDSSSIAVMASRRLSVDDRTLLAYSFLAEIWPGVQIDDETPFVNAVLKQEPAIQWKRIETALPADWLHDHYHPDLPISLKSDSAEHAVYVDASAHGASVLLSGWGGDEGITFNGRGALAAALTRFRWRYLAGEMLALRRERGFRLHNTFVGDVLQPLLSAAKMERLRCVMRRPPLPASLPAAACLQPWLRHCFHNDEILLVAQPARNQRTLLASAHISQRTTGYAMMAARHGIAVSFPFLDRRVVEFALALPAEWHIQKGWKRAVFRDAMEGVLPVEIARRHTKLAPIARVSYEYAKQNMRIQERVEELARHPVVSKIFDTKAMARVAATIPSLQTAAGPAALDMVPWFSQVLTCAMWVEQQF